MRDNFNNQRMSWYAALVSAMQKHPRKFWAPDSGNKFDDGKTLVILKIKMVINLGSDNDRLLKLVSWVSETICPS